MHGPDKRRRVVFAVRLRRQLRLVGWGIGDVEMVFLCRAGNGNRFVVGQVREIGGFLGCVDSVSLWNLNSIDQRPRVRRTGIEITSKPDASLPAASLTLSSFVSLDMPWPCIFSSS